MNFLGFFEYDLADATFGNLEILGLQVQRDFLGDHSSNPVRVHFRIARERSSYLEFFEDPASQLEALYSGLEVPLTSEAHEAMQAGLPVIASRVGELPTSILEGKTGLLCDVGDIRSLADAIATIARDPKRSAEMGEASRLRI